MTPDELANRVRKNMRYWGVSIVGSIKDADGNELLSGDTCVGIRAELTAFAIVDHDSLSEMDEDRLTRETTDSLMRSIDHSFDEGC